ncbi:MAG: manganese efflux pump, partial [Bacilli bacterium]|nr:manganese efflux pump [Bacilli bacterium]
NVFQDSIKKLLKNYNNKLINIYLDETKADFNDSKNLNYVEAFNLSLILSFDSLLGGLSIGISYNYILYIIILSFIINLSFLKLGLYIGKKITLININTSYISGLILIIISFFKIF